VRRNVLSYLILGISAIVVGVAIGYYAGMSGALTVTAGMLGVIGLMLGGLVTAFYGGRMSGRSERPAGASHRSWDAFRRELDRARRFERSFVLMRFPGVDMASADGSTPAPGSLGALPLMVRSIDQVLPIDGSVYVVLPETGLESAQQLIGRLRTAIPGDPALDRVEAVEFPAGGVTTGALVANLRPIGELGADRAPVRLVPPLTDQAEASSERTG
jgi:hypothetical protein